MTGGGRAPAVAHERTEKQDLGLDASSHFAAEGVLHSLTGQPMRTGGGFCPATPLLTSLELRSPFFSILLLISSLLKLFSFSGNVCSLAEQCGSCRGIQGHNQRRGNSRAPGCWAQGPLKGWNERGEYAVAFFSEQKKEKNRKALSSTEITLRCTCKAARIPKQGHK